MANPNKTVAKYRRNNPFPSAGTAKHGDEFNSFMDWVFEQARAGASFKTIEEAEKEYKKQGGK